MSKLATADGSLAAGLQLLESGIPLTLLLDLASDPRSHDLYRNEDPDLDWVPLRLAG